MSGTTHPTSGPSTDRARPLRIAQLVHAMPQDQMGGLERYVGELSGELAARGHDVTVITKRLTRGLPSTEQLAPGLRLVRVPTPERSDATYALGYVLSLTVGPARVIRPGGFDIVHAHYGIQGLGARLAGRPHLYTFHAPVFREFAEDRAGRYRWPSALNAVGAGGLRLIEQTAVRGAGRHLVLSAFMAAEMRLLTGADTPVELVPGGIDTDHFCPGPAATLAGDPWMSGEGPVLFCARRLVPRMGVHNLVEAMPAILSRHPGTRLAVAGTGFLEEQIRPQIAALGLSDHVRLLGRVSDDALRDWYRRADLSVLPSAHLEGFGLSTAEALACGTPVVGTPAGATPELLDQLDPALVSAGTDPAALAVAVSAALDRGAELSALGAAGRRLAVEEWSWQVVTDRHEALYGDFRR